MSDQRFTSGYLIDKISYKTSGSISVPTAVASSDYTQDIKPHTLGYIPNCIAIYTDDPTFDTYYVSGLPPYFFAPGPALYLPRIDCVVRSDVSNIYINFQNLDTTRTLYYKIVGIIPPDVTSAAALDPVMKSDDLLTSDDNFCKIVEDYYATQAISTFSLYKFAIPHNLNYRPMAIGYLVNNGVSIRCGQEASFYTSIGYTSRCWADETYIYIEVSTLTASGDFKAYGRVYLDD